MHTRTVRSDVKVHKNGPVGPGRLVSTSFLETEQMTSSASGSKFLGLLGMAAPPPSVKVEVWTSPHDKNTWSISTVNRSSLISRNPTPQSRTKWSV